MMRVFAELSDWKEACSLLEESTNLFFVVLRGYRIAIYCSR